MGCRYHRHQQAVKQPGGKEEDTHSLARKGAGEGQEGQASASRGFDLCYEMSNDTE